MRLRVTEEIDAPIAAAFSVLTDFESWERVALRRGADVIRADDLREPGLGMAWNVSFPYRGKPRSALLSILSVTQDKRLEMLALSASARTGITFLLTESGPRRTRLQVEVNATPQTIFARVFLLAARLFQGRLTQRLAMRVSQLSTAIETRCYARLR